MAGLLLESPKTTSNFTRLPWRSSAAFIWLAASSTAARYSGDVLPPV